MCGNHLTLTNDFILHQGTLPDTHFHRHGAIILLMTAGNALAIEFDQGTRHSCRSALIDAGVHHRLISQHEPICAFYIEAYHPLSRYLQARYLGQSPAAFDLFSVGEQQRLLAHQDLMAGLIDYFSSRGKTSAARAVSDSRVQRALALADQGASLQHAAILVNLSPSRLSHLFSEQMGLSYKHYKLWRQAKYFIHSLPTRHSLTHHAQQTGYSDSAHLSNTFRKLIGISPSEILKTYTHIIRR